VPSASLERSAPAPAADSAVPSAKGCAAGARLVLAGDYPIGEKEGFPRTHDLAPRRSHLSEPICVDLAEVTVAAFDGCVHASACIAAAKRPACNTEQASRAQDPVNCVTFAQAQAYCAWTGGRLPTEFEWEAAARGMSDVASTLQILVVEIPTAVLRRFCLNRGPAERTCPVDAVPTEGAHGLRGLLGNVSEWTTTPSCPRPDCAAFRVVRGGSWMEHHEEESDYTARDFVRIENARPTLGFRCVRPPA